MQTSYILSLIGATEQNQKVYVQDGDGQVYKIQRDHFLRMSPSDNDRRVYEIDDDNYTILSTKNACMVVNKQYQSTNEKWERNGRKYLASAIPDSRNANEHSALLSLLPSHTISIELADQMQDGHEYSFKDNISLNEFKMVKYKGKVYYILLLNEFLPRVKMYDTFGKFCQWANVKHCKPIYCETTNKYL